MSTATTTGEFRRRERPGDARRKIEAPGVADDILARASAVVARLAAEYPAHARRDIRRLNRLADRMATESDALAAHYHDISGVAHDIRGQGALFGYPMVTRCADSLCRAVRTLPPDDDAAVGLVRIHAAALNAILRDRPGDSRDPSVLFVVAGLEFFVMLRTPNHPK